MQAAPKTTARKESTSTRSGVRCRPSAVRSRLIPRRAHRRRLLRQRRRWPRAGVDRQSRYACAVVGWAGTHSVTAYVGNVRFSRPVRVGDLVEDTAKLVYTGRSSSMHILVTVRSGSVQDRVLTDATQTGDR
jgi:hypothetical protein